MEPIRAGRRASRLRAVRNGLDDARRWSSCSRGREEEFDGGMAGSAIRRIGYERWLRNIAVGLGNAPPIAAIVAALRARADDPSPLVREHVAWAIRRQKSVRQLTADSCGVVFGGGASSAVYRFSTSIQRR